MLASLLTAVVQFRVMEPEDRGLYALALPIIMISSLFFEVGFSPAGGRVLALADDQERQRRTLGALVLMATLIGAALSLFLLASALPFAAFFDKNIAPILFLAAGFAFVIPFQSVIQDGCQGLNQIPKLSAYQLGFALMNLTLQCALAFTGNLTSKLALLAYLTAIGLSALWTLARLRPDFSDFSRYLKLTLQEMRRYGLNIYLSRITGTVSTQVDNLVIAYFIPQTAPLALYDNAQKVSNPIVMLARSISITRFRAFVGLNSVPASIRRWNAGLLIVASLLLATIGPFALKLVFPKYAEAGDLLLPFAFWSLFGGLFQPYHTFLLSHGRGAEIRNKALLLTIADITGLLIAVPRFGIYGAAWVAAGSMLLDYLLTLYYYHKFRRTLINEGVKE